MDSLKQRLEFLEMLDEQQLPNLQLMTVKELSMYYSYEVRKNTGKVCDCEKQQIKSIRMAVASRTAKPWEPEHLYVYTSKIDSITHALSALHLIDISRYDYDFSKIYSSIPHMLEIAEHIQEGKACQYEKQYLSEYIESVPRYDKVRTIA